MMCVCAIILVILINLGKSGNPQRFDQVTRLSEGWYYMEGNEKVYVTLPAPNQTGERGSTGTLL